MTDTNGGLIEPGPVLRLDTSDRIDYLYGSHLMEHLGDRLAFEVYAYITLRANGNGETWRAQRGIAKVMRLTELELEAVMAFLEGKGVLTRAFRAPQGLRDQRWVITLHQPSYMTYTTISESFSYNVASKKDTCQSKHDSLSSPYKQNYQITRNPTLDSPSNPQPRPRPGGPLA